MTNTDANANILDTAVKAFPNSRVSREVSDKFTTVVDVVDWLHEIQERVDSVTDSRVNTRSGFTVCLNGYVYRTE